MEANAEHLDRLGAHESSIVGSGLMFCGSWSNGVDQRAVQSESVRSSATRSPT
jgi:hypothetical protein